MSSNNTLTANLVATRGNRCSASILGWLEDNLYSKYDIDEQMQRRIRQMILDNVNTFKDLAIDIVKSDAALMNEVWVQKLDQIHEELRGRRG